MTDITGKDNLYYTVQQYNPYTEERQAEVDVSLVYPLLQTASDYQVSISKARIDLSTIPLTRSNIPLKKYQVGLRSGTTEATAYVRQLGVTVGNFVYNATVGGSITKSKYTATGSTTLVSTVDISAVIKTVGFFCVDDFENFYVAGSGVQDSTIYDLFVIFDKDGNVLFSNQFYQIRALTIDRQQRIFIGEESETIGSAVLVYDNVNGEASVSLTLATTLTTDFNGAPLAEIQTVCADVQIIVGSGFNTITFYDGVSFEPLTTFNQDTITQLASPSAIMSEYDRFVVSDNGTANDFFYGVSDVGGSQEVVNMETNTSFVGGLWTNQSKMALTQGGYGYGVGTDSRTWAFTYDKTTGAVGAPFNANSVTPVSNIISCQNSVGFDGLFANDTGNNLYAWESDNVLGTNTWYEVDTHFTDSVHPFVSMDYQDSTHKIVAVGTDNKIYRSSLPILPKQFFVGDYVLPSTTLRQYGVGWNAQGTQEAFTQLSTSYTPYSNVISGYYKNGQNAYALTGNDGGNMAVYKQSLPNQVIGANFPIIEANTYYTAGNPIAICPAGAGYFAVSNGYNGVSQPQVFIYSETDGSHLSSITMPTVPATFDGNFYGIDSIEYNSHVYLAITGVTQIYIYDITTPASPSLVTQFPFIPATYAPQTVYNLKWVNIPGDVPILCALSNGNGSSAQALFVVGFTNDTFSTFEPASCPLIYQGGQGFTTYCSALQSNFYTGELYAMVGSPTETSSTILAFKVATQTQVSTINLTGLTSEDSLGFYHCPPDASYTYSWLEVAQTTSKLARCVSMGKINTNAIYILDTTYTPWKGTLVNGTVASWTAVAGISGTWASMNVYPVPQTIFNGIAYAYGLTTGQTLHGSYIAGANKIVSLTRNDVSGEFLLSTSAGAIVSLTPASLTTSWTTSSVSGTYAIWTKNSSDIDAGSYDIFTYATLIEAINQAFLEAYAKLPAGTFTEAPTMSLDYATGLLSLAYSSDYAPSPASSSIGILFNGPLIQLCFFNSAVDTINADLRLLTLKPGSTSTIQGNRSVYQFNQLDKIVFISNTIYVFGSYFGNNNTNNIIQDIDVPTSSAGYMDNVGQVLYFQPTFLRPFMLASNNALQRVQLSVNYVYLDGTQYPLMVAPGNNWSAKLLFPRRY